MNIIHDMQQRLRVPEHVLFRGLPGESVLLNLDSESYFGLDEVGPHMWEVLTKADTMQEAYDILLAEYDVDPETLRQGMNHLVEELLAQGLLELQDG